MSPPLALVGVRPDFLRDLEPRVGVRSASDSSSPDPTGELDLEAVPLPLRPLVSVSKTEKITILFLYYIEARNIQFLTFDSTKSFVDGFISLGRS